MNRPKIEDYLTSRMYREALERYCDQLEKNKDKQFNAGFNEATKICSEKIIALEEALDKACTELVKMKLCASCYEYKESGCPFANKCELGTDYCYNKEHWKEWALKDE